MTKERVCANTQALPRRSFLAGAAATPFAVDPLFAGANMKATDFPQYAKESDALIHARIAKICEWTGAPMPEMLTEDGELLCTDNFWSWHKKNHFSLDLTCCGDVQNVIVRHYNLVRAIYERAGER